MDTETRHQHLRAIAAMLEDTDNSRVVAHTVPQLRDMDPEQREWHLQDLAAEGLITIHEGRYRGGGVRSHVIALTELGTAALAHPSPSPPATDSAPLDRWHDRDLPVLSELAKAEEQHTAVRLETIMANTGLQFAEVRASVARLIRTGYVDQARFTADDGGKYAHCRMSKMGLEAVGHWPSAEAGADRLLEVLDHLAQHAPDEPTRSKLRAALSQLGGLSRDTLAGIAAAVLTGQLPGHS